MSCGCILRKRILKKNIKLDKRDVYLDYNATTKPSIDVLLAVDKINRNYWGNPSAQNSRGVNLYNIIKTETSKIKKQLGLVDFDFFYDVSSSSVVQNIKKKLLNKEILTSQIEHKSLLNLSNKVLGVDKMGYINLDDLSQKNTKKTILIYSPVNHETGNIQPYIQIYNKAKELGISVIFDAVQTISRIHINKWLNYCDGFYYSGHKIYGVQGAAALAIKKGIIDFNIQDSPLPFSLYQGTMNSCAVIGLLKATDLLYRKFNKSFQEISILHREALDILGNIRLPIHFESNRGSVPGIINLSIPEIDKIEDLLFFLNNDGIQISRLSACSGDIGKESYVLKAMDRDYKRATTSLRISFGSGSKRDDFFRLTASINKFISSI